MRQYVKGCFLIRCAVVMVLGAGTYCVTAGGEEGSHSITPPEGGTWDYGASGGRTWSNFQHDRPHHASVTGHRYEDSGCVRGGDWARAQTDSRWISVLGNTQEKGWCDEASDGDEPR